MWGGEDVKTCIFEKAAVGKMFPRVELQSK